MNFSCISGNKEMTLLVKIQTFKPEKICLRVSDYDNNKTYFLDRYKTINGIETLEVMMPITPKKMHISVYNEKNGNQKEGIDKSFKIIGFFQKPLKTRLELIPLFKIGNFINLAERISLHSSYLDCKTYTSDNGKFFIELLPVIIGSDGNELSTPARISKTSGLIQISKKHFDTYTVPMRMAILLHEFSHYYINENIDDESEADLNGLLIYLCLGYPRIEAHEAWLDVFTGSASEANGERYKLISKFITDFENKNI